MRSIINGIKNGGFRPAYIRIVLACLFLGVVSNAQAAYTPLTVLDKLELPGAAWEPTLVMQLTDQPIHVRSFTSTRQPVQLAQSLAQQSNIFQRILTGKHKIVLSGLQPGWHWLAEINAVPEGARGYVSALYVDAARLQPSDATQAQAGKPETVLDPVYSWLPAGSRRRFSYSSAEFSQRLTQEIYSVPVSVTQLLADVSHRLQAQGWQADLATAGQDGLRGWSRQGHLLRLFAYTDSPGAAVLIHHLR